MDKPGHPRNNIFFMRGFFFLVWCWKILEDGGPLGPGGPPIGGKPGPPPHHYFFDAGIFFVVLSWEILGRCWSDVVRRYSFNSLFVTEKSVPFLMA